MGENCRMEILYMDPDTYTSISTHEMRQSILSQNRANVLQVMDTYIEKMQAFRQAVDEMDEARIRELIEEANRIKKILR